MRSLASSSASSGDAMMYAVDRVGHKAASEISGERPKYLQVGLATWQMGLATRCARLIISVASAFTTLRIYS